MNVREIMTKQPTCCSPDDTIETAAHLMEETDCGCLPVVANQGGGLVGVVTDRDIAVRAVGRGRSTDTLVRDVMTKSPHSCGPQNDVRELENLMSERQIRRVPIVDDSQKCVGIVAQADLARAASRHHELSDDEFGRVVERISEPSARTGSSALSS